MENKTCILSPAIIRVIEDTLLISVLASDGLWDTHNNKEAVALVKDRLGKDRLMGAETLAREAFSRGSLDNITVLVIDLKKFRK